MSISISGFWYIFPFPKTLPQITLLRPPLSKPSLQAIIILPIIRYQIIARFFLLALVDLHCLDIPFSHRILYIHFYPYK